MICTTLNRIYEYDSRKVGWPTRWKKLLDHLKKIKADDEPLLYLTILESNGVDDCVWYFGVEPQYAPVWRLFAVWCARQDEHLLTDQRSRDELDVAERYANGNATDDELAAARDAARDAVMAGDAQFATGVARKNAAEAALFANDSLGFEVAGTVAYDNMRDSLAVYLRGLLEKTTTEGAG